MNTLPRSATVMSKLVVSGKVIVGIDKPVGADGSVSQLNLPPALVIPFIVSELASTGFTKHSSATVSPAHGGSFDVVGCLNRDANGHVTSAIEKTVTLPSETVLSTGSGAAYTSTTGNAITGLAVSGHKITCTVGGNFRTSISGAGEDAYL